MLKELPKNFSTVTVVIQHIDQQFCPGLIEWMNELIYLPTRIAEQGEIPKAGHVYISAGDKHLSMDETGRFSYSKEPVDYPYQPSVNVFFHSVAENWTGNAYGVLLTGMGKDGAEGLLALKQQGFPTIAQDEKSCAVYGMPKEAAKLNAAKYILPLDEIAAKLVNSLN